MKNKIVIALGGNALGNSPKEQLELVKNTASSIVDLIEDGNDVIIGHGNGPQVGMINLAMENAFNSNVGPEIPFPECGAMSQGYIGYHLQQAIANELSRRKIKKNCSTIVTQVVVSENDEAFANETKPIGSFYTKKEAESLSKQNGYKYVEDSGRGYRRVVASPDPLNIVEIDTIDKVSNLGDVVIAVGGGGIPVIKTENGYEGIPAVIDKDKSCSLLATSLDADMLIILTAVEKVAINFGKENQSDLDSLTIDEAEKYISEKQFAEGSMLPKIEASLDFVNNSTNGTAIITSLDKLKEAVNNKTGTIITKNKVLEDKKTRSL